MNKLEVARFAYIAVVVLLNLVAAGFFLFNPIRKSRYQKSSLNYFLAFFVCLALGFIVFGFNAEQQNFLTVVWICVFFLSAFYCLKYGFVWRLNRYAKHVYQDPYYYLNLALLIFLNGYIFHVWQDSNAFRTAILVSNCCLVAVFSIKHVAAKPPRYSFGEKVAIAGITLAAVFAMLMLLLLQLSYDPFMYLSALMVSQSLVVLVILGSTLTMALSDISELYYKDSITDELTGLYNRRFFLAQASLAVKSASRYDFPISIIICDIDNFKRINDTWGHDVGDQAIIQFSRIIKLAARETDTIARLGGDEFILLLPRSGIEGAYGLADRMRELVAEEPLESAKGEVHFTASFGVSSFESTDSIEKNIKEADIALYVAKRMGRNNVQSFNPEMSMTDSDIDAKA